MARKLIKSIIVILIIIFYLSPIIIHAEETERSVSFYLLPDENFYNDPNYLVVNIFAYTASNSINAVNIDLKFDDEKLSLMNSELNSSLCMFTIMNGVDSGSGDYYLSCGTPIPLSDEKIKVAQLMFEKTGDGWVNFEFSNDSIILAADGFGTNILESLETHNIYLPTEEERNNL